MLLTTNFSKHFVKVYFLCYEANTHTPPIPTSTFESDDET